MTIKDIIGRLDKVRSSGKGYVACCPAHDDNNPSLSVAEGEDGRVLLHCFAGCSVASILEALDLTMEDIMPPQKADSKSGEAKTGKGPVVAEYKYKGGTAFKLRYANKAFNWKYMDVKTGKWIWHKPPEKLLYLATNGNHFGPRNTVFVVEGEKDADNLHQLGFDAVSGPIGAGQGNFRDKAKYEILTGCDKVYVIPDNDAIGHAYATEEANCVREVAENVFLLDLNNAWPEIPEKGDVSDMIEALGPEEAKARLMKLMDAAEEWEPQPEVWPDNPKTDKPKKASFISAVSAPDLLGMELKPVEYLVEDLMPEGTTILSAASKIGKSWLVLDLGLSVAAGSKFMGKQTKKTGVLYLALEDGFNRLQDRMKKVLDGEPPPPLFFFANKAPTLKDGGLLDALEEYRKAQPELGLVIIDTLQKVRGPSGSRENAYDRDYREMGAMKQFFDELGISAIFVHHNRKMKDEDDIFQQISGTTGIMGAVDTAWVIAKKKRDSETATLHIAGRDAMPADLEIQFEEENWKWRNLGDASWVAEQRAKREYEESPIVEAVKKLIEAAPDHHWKGNAQALLTQAKFVVNRFIAATSNDLNKKVNGLTEPLFRYDGIVHEITGKNKTNSGTHHFYYRDSNKFGSLPFVEFTDTDEEVPFN